MECISEDRRVSSSRRPDGDTLKLCSDVVSSASLVVLLSESPPSMLLMESSIPFFLAARLSSEVRKFEVSSCWTVRADDSLALSLDSWRSALWIEKRAALSGIGGGLSFFF